jgi:hypothetical protein
VAEVWRERLERAAWLLLALALPFTSFPLVRRLSGSSMVAPAAGLVLLALVLGWLLPYLLRGGKLGRQSLPLLAFLSVSLLSGAAAFFLSIPPYRDFSLLRSELEAFITLAMGACFYLAVAAWTVREERLSFLLRWINWSGLVIVAWSLLQALVFRVQHGYPGWMAGIQSVFVTTELYAGRANGFAFEPSWLAHQLNMLYLPWWLAASVRGTTVHRMRLGPLTLERVLLAGGALALVLSVSRIGLLGFLLMLAFLLLLGVLPLVGRLERRLLANNPLSSARLAWARAALRGGLLLGMAALALGMFLAAGYALSRYDPRMADLFNLKTLQAQSFIAYANKLVFAERIIFWDAGWQVFNRYPILGVGPGNAGFFFPQALSSFSWNLTEVRTLMFRLDVLPNIKSLWVRLLAETGLAGFACFTAFLYVHARFAAWLRRYSSLMGTVGLAGMFVLVGLLTEGFSVDTFGLPYYWVALGLVAGACSIRREG